MLEPYEEVFAELLVTFVAFLGGVDVVFVVLTLTEVLVDVVVLVLTVEFV